MASTDHLIPPYDKYIREWLSYMEDRLEAYGLDWACLKSYFNRLFNFIAISYFVKLYNLNFLNEPSITIDSNKKATINNKRGTIASTKFDTIYFTSPITPFFAIKNSNQTTYIIISFISSLKPTLLIKYLNNTNINLTLASFTTFSPIK